MGIKDNEINAVSIAVIDTKKSPCTLTLYCVPDTWSNKDVIAWLETQGHDETQICFGAFDGTINDQRPDNEKL